jgi:hypothetical protein
MLATFFLVEKKKLLNSIPTKIQATSKFSASTTTCEIYKRNKNFNEKSHQKTKPWAWFGVCCWKQLQGAIVDVGGVLGIKVLGAGIGHGMTQAWQITRGGGEVVCMKYWSVGCCVWSCKWGQQILSC